MGLGVERFRGLITTPLNPYTSKPLNLSTSKPLHLSTSPPFQLKIIIEHKIPKVHVYLVDDVFFRQACLSGIGFVNIEQLGA
jgi:hypothetical protein